MKEQAPATKKIPVSIDGVTYYLLSHADENYTRQLAANVNELLIKLSRENPKLSGTQTNVLALVNLFDVLAQKDIEIEKLKASYSKIAVSVSGIEKELNEQREQGFELKKEVLRLTDFNKQLVIELSKASKPETVPEPSVEVLEELLETEPEASNACAATASTRSDPEIDSGFAQETQVVYTHDVEDEYVEAAEFVYDQDGNFDDVSMQPANEQYSELNEQSLDDYLSGAL